VKAGNSATGARFCMAPPFARMTARAIVSHLPDTRSRVYWTRVKAHPTSFGWTVRLFQQGLSRDVERLSPGELSSDFPVRVGASVNVDVAVAVSQEHNERVHRYRGVPSRRDRSGADHAGS